MTDQATAAAVQTVTWTQWRSDEETEEWIDWTEICVGVSGDLPDYMPDNCIEIPMTLVMGSGFERDDIATLIDELQSGEQGLDLAGWGVLHVGWNSEKAVI